MRIDDLVNFTFDDGPYLWTRPEIKNRPIFAHEDIHGILECVIEDIEKVRNIVNKAIGQEAMFTPRYFASAFITLLRRLMPFEPTWVPAFELQGKEIFPDCSYYILKLDEEYKKWTLIAWFGSEIKFTSLDFPVLPDQRIGHYGDLSMTSLYKIMDQEIYQKVDQLYSRSFMPRDYPEIFRGY